MKDMYSTSIEPTPGHHKVVAMVYTMSGSPGPTLITHVWTHPDVRGKGLGYASRLFDAVLQDADHEQQELLLDLQPDPPSYRNQNGLTAEQLASWFQRCGFAFIFEAQPKHGPIPADTTMRRLPRPPEEFQRERRTP